MLGEKKTKTKTLYISKPSISFLPPQSPCIPFPSSAQSYLQFWPLILSPSSESCSWTPGANWRRIQRLKIAQGQAWRVTSCKKAKKNYPQNIIPARGLSRVRLRLRLHVKLGSCLCLPLLDSVCHSLSISPDELPLKITCTWTFTPGSTFRE